MIEREVVQMREARQKKTDTLYKGLKEDGIKYLEENRIKTGTDSEEAHAKAERDIGIYGSGLRKYAEKKTGVFGGLYDPKGKKLPYMIELSTDSDSTGDTGIMDGVDIELAKLYFENGEPADGSILEVLINSDLGKEQYSGKNKFIDHAKKVGSAAACMFPPYLGHVVYKDSESKWIAFNVAAAEAGVITVIVAQLVFG